MSDLPATSPIEDDAADDAAAEEFADLIIALALAAPGPVRILALRWAGLLPPVGSPISQAAIAAGLGISRWQVRQLEERALRRAERAARKLFPPQPTNPEDPQP